MKKYSIILLIFLSPLLYAQNDFILKNTSDTTSSNNNDDILITSKLWDAFNKSTQTIEYNLLIDFSYAGYQFGEQDIPTAYTLPIFKVSDYNAFPNDDKSDHLGIQNAILAAEKVNGGVILFQKGTYLINEQPDSSESIIIKNSNIILKGSGSNANGTVLFMKNHLKPYAENKKWTTPPMIHFFGNPTEALITNKIAKNSTLGEKQIRFENKVNLKSGDVILIQTQGVFLNEKMLQGKKPRNIWSRINEKGTKIMEYHQIDSVSNQTVYLKTPLLIDIDKSAPWEVYKCNFLENCAFENIRFEGNFLDPFIHHKNARHDSGYSAVRITNCVNSWVRDCTFNNVSDAVKIKFSLGCSITNCSLTGNAGHNSFGVSTATHCLISDCNDTTGAWHGPSVSSCAVGNVFLRFNGVNTGIDAHATYPRFTLYDNCTMNGLDGKNMDETSHGGAYTNLPNHLQGLVFWNFNQTGTPRPNFDFWNTLQNEPNRKYGPLTAVNPIIVGLHGVQQQSFYNKNVGYIESIGKKVEPLSLYIAQMIRRKTSVPKYLKIKYKRI